MKVKGASCPYLGFGMRAACERHSNTKETILIIPLSISKRFLGKAIEPVYA